MTPPRLTIDRSQRLRVMRLLLDAEFTPAMAAEASGIPYDTVLDIANRHGYPDPTNMAKCIEMLQDALDTPHVDVPTPKTDIERAKEAVMSDPDSTADLDSVSALVEMGRAGTTKRTVAMANRFADLAKDLQKRVIDEKAERENQARIAELQAEIDRLRQRSAALVCRVDGCGHPAPSLQGLNTHRTRSHRLPNLTQEQAEQEVES